MSVVDRIIDGAHAILVESPLYDVDSRHVLPPAHLMSVEWEIIVPYRRMIRGSNFKLNLTSHAPQTLPQ